MSITDLLTPKWKNSDPSVRLTAVQNLNQSQQSIFQKVAINDTDTKVRVAALNQINNPAFLTEFEGGHYGHEIQKIIDFRLDVLHRSMLPDLKPEKRPAMVALIRSETTLTEIALELDDQEVRTAIVIKLSNSHCLCKIAESNCGFKIGELIVAKLDGPEFLKRIAKNASNKKIRKMADFKLNKETEIEIVAEDQALEKVATAKAEYLGEVAYAKDLLDELIQMLTELNNAEPDSEKLKTKISEVCNRWSKTAAGFSPKVKAVPEVEKRVQQFNLLVDQSRQVLRTIVQNQLEDQLVLDQLEGCCCELEKLIPVEDHSNAWQTMIEQKNQIEEQFNTDLQTLKQSYDILDTLKQKFTDNRQKIMTEYDAFKVRLQERAATQQEKLSALCTLVEEAVAAEKRQGLEKAVKEARREWKNFGDLVPEFKEKLNQRFQSALEQFFKKQAEFQRLRDWNLWANLNQKIKLCELLEKLAQQEDIAGGRAISDCHQQWKQIGPVASDKADQIWERFQKACYLVNQRCLKYKTKLYQKLTKLTTSYNTGINWNSATNIVKQIQREWNEAGTLPTAMEEDLRMAFRTECNNFFDKRREFFKERDQSRQENLKLKTEMCKQAEELMQSTDWSQTAKILHELQVKWRKTGPIPKQFGDELWHRFRQACDIFFEKIREIEPANFKQKQQLCEEVEKLLQEYDQENSDLELMRRTIIDLQSKWKEIGPVPHKDAGPLWRRFREPCDQFFSQYKDSKDNQRKHQDEILQAKEALIAEVQELAVSKEWKAAAERLKAIRREWQEIGHVERQTEQALWKRFNEVCDLFFSQRRHFFEEFDQIRKQNFEQKQKICLSAEVLARLVFPEQAPYELQEFVAEQVMLGRQLTDDIAAETQQKTMEKAVGKVKQFQSEWKKIGPAGNDRQLWERFRKATGLFFHK